MLECSHCYVFRVFLCVLNCSCYSKALQVLGSCYVLACLLSSYHPLSKNHKCVITPQQVAKCEVKLMSVARHILLLMVKGLLKSLTLRNSKSDVCLWKHHN